MFRRYRHLLPFLALLLAIAPAYASAASLEQQLTRLVNNGLDKNITRSVTVLTPQKQLETLCAEPKLSLSGNDTRLAGNRSVIAQCGTERKFLQIAIKAEGRWWVASRTLATGTQIQAEDIKPQQGSMDRLPGGLLLNKDDIIGRITTRSVNVGQPLQANQLRQNWAITAGEDVEVVAQGTGFHIRASGKAMDNAAIGGNIRIKTKNGQIVTGKVISAGKVSISLQH